MLETLLSPTHVPFTVALGVMLLIAITEAMGTLFGISPAGLLDQLLPDADLDIDIDADADVDAGGGTGQPQGFLSHLLGWLCVGRVPILVLLVAFLTAFGLAGFLLQGTVNAVLGFYMSPLLAGVGTLFLAAPPTRWLALGLSRIMPKEESDAVSSKTFIGKIAVITRGVARRDVPAEAKLRDAHGQMHYVLVEPDDDESEFEQGTEVLLTSQSSAIRFRAIRNDHALMSDS